MTTPPTGSGSGPGSTLPPPPYRGPGPRQLRRRPDEGHVAGVCAGVAEYFNIDPVIVRIAAVVLLFTGPGAIAYILAWIFVPEAPTGSSHHLPGPSERRDRGAQIFGLVLLAISVSILWGGWWSPARRWFFPLGLMVLGTWLILRRDRGDDEPGPSQPSAGPTAHGVTPGPMWPVPPAPGTDPTTADATRSTPWGAREVIAPAGAATSTSPPTDADTADAAGEADAAGTPEADTGDAAAADAERGADRGASPEAGGGSDDDGTGDTTTEATDEVDAATEPFDSGREPTAVGDGGDETAVTDAASEGGGSGHPPWGHGSWGHGPLGPDPVPEVPESVLAARRRRRMVFPIVMGALLLWTGLAFLTGVSIQSGLAIALCIVGVGFVLGAFVGGSKLLILPALLVGSALAVTSVLDIPLSGPIGKRMWEPQTLAEVNHRYQISIGEGTLDLTAIPFEEGDHLDVRATVGIGHLVINVPDGVGLEVSADVAMGGAELLGRENAGVGVSVDRSYGPEDPTSTINLDLEVGLGQIEVIILPTNTRSLR